ncbi:MAG: glycosyltransferase [Bdellovibrionota bacterium]
MLAPPFYASLGQGAQAFLNFACVFFLLATALYTVLLFIAWMSVKKRKRSSLSLQERILRISKSAESPPISIIIPAYNEEAVITDSVKSFLSLSYPKYEVIVVNDGSHDHSMTVLKEHFQLEEAKIEGYKPLSNSPIRKSYRSKIDPRLIVIDKTNTGKADSLNVGIGVARHDIICSVDADTIPEPDCLSKTIIPFIDRPGETIATGGTVRVINGCQLKSQKVEKSTLPSNFWALFQVVEYVRVFFCGRVGWNSFNATIIISGAFGLFSKQAIIEAGGYSEDSISEDLDLIVKLHRLYREKKLPYHIEFIPDPVCWTQVPEDISSLYEQRRRWQRGLIETLFDNLGILFNPKYGTLGCLAFPYHLFVGIFGPAVEILTYLAILTAHLCGALNHEIVLTFFIVGFGYSALITIGSVWLEEQYYSHNKLKRNFWIMSILGILENFGFRQLLSLWRVMSLVVGVRRTKSWRQIPRISFGT